MVRPSEIIKTSDISAILEGDVGPDYYWKKGKPYPRVTSVIKSTTSQYVLEKWKQRTPDHEEISRVACDRGTAYHYWTMQMLRPYGLNVSHLHPPDPDTHDEDELDKFLDISQRFIDTVHPCGIMICEWPLYHEKAIYAGTFDIITSFNIDQMWDDMVLEFSHFHFLDPEPKKSDRWLVDLKTSKSVRKEVRAQLGAYLLLCNACGIEVDRMGVLQNNIETDWEFRELDIITAVQEWQNHWLKFNKKYREKMVFS